MNTKEKLKVWRYYFTLIMLVLLVQACVNVSTGKVALTRLGLSLGDSRIYLLEHAAGTRDLTMINLHDDENSGVEAALNFVENKGGRFYELSHNGNRNITFDLEGVTYKFDPNRMFTEPGLRESMESFGPVSELAVGAVLEFKEQILEKLDLTRAGIVVAVHNNTDNNYSALSYTDNHDLVREAARYDLKDGQDPDNFFFVTDSKYYDQLANSRFNVVEQNNEMVTDDGSLSVYCASIGIPYVNIEAQHGEIDEQLAMFYFLGTIIN